MSIKIEEMTCKVIVDNESYINAIFAEVIEKDGLKSLPHSYPFKVPWTNSTALGVKQLCFVLMDFLYF